MKTSNFLLLLAVLICINILFAPQKTLFAAVPVQIRINVNAVPDNQVAKQLQILKELHLLFKNNNVHAGFWFNGEAYREIIAHDPKILKQLFADNFVIAYHGANRGKKGCRPVDKVTGMDWDTAVDWVV